MKIQPFKLELSCTQENFTFLTFLTLTFDLGSQNMVEDTSFLIPFHVVKFENPTPMGGMKRASLTDGWIDGLMDGHVRLL